jgi:hypothetical protein
MRKKKISSTPSKQSTLVIVRSLSSAEAFEEINLNP